MTDLQALYDAVNDPDNFGDDEIRRLAVATGLSAFDAGGCVSAACYADMNAASHIARVMLHGWMWSMKADGSASIWRGDMFAQTISQATADTPARALLLAALAAMIARETA